MTVPTNFRRNTEIPDVLVLHYADLPQSDVKTVQGFKITRPLRAILDLIEAGTVERNFVLQALMQGVGRGLKSYHRKLRTLPICAEPERIKTFAMVPLIGRLMPSSSNLRDGVDYPPLLSGGTFPEELNRLFCSRNVSLDPSQINAKPEETTPGRCDGFRLRACGSALPRRLDRRWTRPDGATGGRSGAGWRHEPRRLGNATERV